MSYGWKLKTVSKAFFSVQFSLFSWWLITKPLNTVVSEMLRQRLLAITQISCHTGMTSGQAGGHSQQWPLVNLNADVSARQSNANVKLERSKDWIQRNFSMSTRVTCLSQGIMHFMLCLFLLWKTCQRKRVTDGIA